MGIPPIFGDEHSDGPLPGTPSLLGVDPLVIVVGITYCVALPPVGGGDVGDVIPYMCSDIDK